MTPRPARSLTAIGITALPGGGVAAVVAAAAPANAAATNLLTNPGFETGVHRAADDRRGVGVAGPAGQVASNPDADGRRPPTGLAQVLDVKHVGVFGHSGDGFTALEAMYEDPRIDAAIDMDGTLEYTQNPDGTHLSPIAQHGLAKPFLLLGSDGTDGSNLGNEPSWASLWRHSTGWKADITLPGTRHGSYTDAEVLIPQLAVSMSADIETADPERTLAEERGLISGFFRHWL